MSELKLKNCPFCNCTMSVRSNRDWHRPEGDHEDHCPVDDTVLMYPATDIGLSALVNCWNTRVTQPEATKPAQDLGAAILAIPLPEIGRNFQQGFRTALRKAAAIASSANALSAGDRVDAVLFERLFNEYMTVISSAYCQCDLDEELAEQCMTAIQAQKDGQ